jgi:hypothetical protein
LEEDILERFGKTDIKSINTGINAYMSI